MEIGSYKKAAAFINTTYESSAMRSFVFGLPEVTSRDIQGIGAINKVLTVEFLLIYLNWLNTPSRKLRTYTSKRFERATEVMKSLYRTQKFDLDVIIYVLGEGQKDIAEIGEESFFYPLMDTTTKCEFGTIYSMIDDWANDLQTSEGDFDKIMQHFVSVVTMAKALFKSDIVTEKDGNDLTTRLVFDGAPLKTYDVVRIDKMGNRFVLVDMRYDKDDVLYRYMTIDDLSYETIIKKSNRR